MGNHEEKYKFSYTKIGPTSGDETIVDDGLVSVVFSSVSCIGTLRVKDDKQDVSITIEDGHVDAIIKALSDLKGYCKYC